MAEGSQLVRCSECKRLVDPGRFCEQCLKPLMPLVEEDAEGENDSSAPSASPRGQIPNAQPPIPSTHFYAPPTSPRGDLSDARLSTPASAAAPDLQSVVGVITSPSAPTAQYPIPNPQSPIPNPQSPIPNTQIPLQVEYNFARAFVVGQMYPFQFRIQARQPDIERVAICFRGFLNGNPLPPDQEVTVEVSEYYAAPWDVTFAPTGNTAGAPSIRIYLGWQIRGESSWQWLQASVQHHIYPAQTPARDVARSLAININANVENNGHANDANTRIVVDDLERLAAQCDPHRQAVDLIGQLADRQLFKELWLVPSRPPVPTPRLDNPVPAAAQVEALTLRMGEERLHLMSQSQLRFGRRHELSDLVLRTFGKGGQLDKSLSRMISKKHGVVDHQGQRCVIRDNSSLGTAIDGKKLADGEEVVLKPQGKHRLRLAPGYGGSGAPLEFMLETWQCGGYATGECPHQSDCLPSAPAALHIQRSDTLKESYLVVWHCAPLEKFFSGLSSMRVYRWQGAFQLRRSGSEPVWLTPGLRLGSDDGEVRVEEFKQLGLDRKSN